ncbi:Hypothetical protein R9X50_00524000 [Acrodontium crateriforme]|uniref:DUF3752 domain-containing protein n=1 Tax=Acrodontium crateriforme TaxID=150365 RepID=A0AAQ3M7H3_9PEZI|nr:Hypothetical protein R9X50_00524000 [Acrodontium crateriforme]
MSGIGPALPPHLLAKRKRKEEDESPDAPARASGAKRSPSPNEAEKRRKVMGPSMPPAPLDKRPSEPANPVESESSDDDDDFGPSLPPSNGDEATNYNDDDQELDDQSAQQKLAARPQRDEWMTMAPKQDDLAARMDPTKIRARGFNTGKGAKGPNAIGDDGSSWNETPEQKMKRLQDEMMGITRPSASKPGSDLNVAKATRDEAAAARIQELTKTRGPTLMEKHAGTKAAEQEDDPSKRAFDREKDMGSGQRIGHAQRKQMLNKAADFSTKFSGGSYL